MKKKILVIGIIIIIFICGLFLVTKTLKKENNNGKGSNDNHAKSYEIIDEKANEDYKTLLKIQSGGDTDVDSPDIEYKEIDYNYKIDLNKVVETVPAITYNNNEELKDIVEIIKDKFNITIDNSWKYSIHYPSSDLSFGYITFLYYIDNIIETNKYIYFTINNGVIEKIAYAYLDKKINENEVLYRYNYFINHYKQKKGLVQDYVNQYAIESEDTKYIYNYTNNKLHYTFNIIYKEKNSGFTTIDWGTETYIEPKLIENLIKSKKIVVKDASNKEVNTISDQKDITKITELLSRTIPIKNNKNSENNNWNLSLYDENNELINIININNDGTLGIDNIKNEYLKEQYFNELTKLLKQ